MTDRDAQIATLYRQGYTYVQISAQVGLSRSATQARCVKMGLTTELPRKRGAIGQGDPRASTGRRVIGERLRAWLAESGKTQAQIEDALGLAHSSLSNWVRGIRLPNRTAAAAIEQYFGQPEGSLYAGTGFRPYRSSGNTRKAPQRACRCCEVLLDQIQESSTRGLCVLCVADIQGLQRKGLLHETDLLAAALEWRELGEADLRERLWLEECADAGIEMAREEIMAEL